MSATRTVLERAAAWAAHMEATGVRVSGPRHLIVLGRKVWTLRSFTDGLGNVTAFTDSGRVEQYLRGEVAPALPLDAPALWVAGVGVMKDPSRWPMRRVLALVRPARSGDAGWGEDVGFLVRGRGARLYLGNVSAIGPGPIAAQVVAWPSLSYVSFEAIAADGWRVA